MITIYFIVVLFVFMLTLWAIWGRDERRLSWAPELMVISLVWPLIIFVNIKRTR